MNINLRKFKEEDIITLSPIMKEAFENDSRIHLGEDVLDGPPGYSDGSFLRQWAMHRNATSLTIYDDDKIIGLAILWINSNHHNMLGCLFIDVAYEGIGVGTKVWKMIEEMFPETLEWNTETPTYSKRNLHFYKDKCSFIVERINEEEGQYIFKKKMK